MLLLHDNHEQSSSYPIFQSPSLIYTDLYENLIPKLNWEQTQSST